VKIALQLPTLRPKAFACGHDFAAVAFWIETRQSLLQRQMHIGDRPDHNLTAFDRNANALVGMQMRFAGDGRGQSDAEIVAPLLDIENRFGHFGLLKRIA
jgi:hypothetical protein